ncbi:MAG TPA: YfhO family protein, partial [Thermomicrobiales bacterium]|nr:YfhO family protein [Thermomicrobiales bacterium]
HSNPIVMESLEREISPSDPGGAGDFLLARQAADGPFRYVGYGGMAYPGDTARRANYMERRFDPGVQAILVNGRPMLLGLDEIQGYDPIELARYAEFMRALNGADQNYHTAYLLASGTGSPLLDLLDVRYALVDAALPQDRPDVVALANGGRKVFANDHVIVYERQPNARRAWIVHDVRPADRDDPVAPIADGTVDPFRTAFVEGAPPAVAPATGPESATITQDDGDTISVDVTATAPGLLVLSEPYASGWQATIDGKPAPILPTDLLLRGVPIPTGEHRVALRYAPPPLRIGLAISAVAGAAMLAAFAWAGWRRFHSPA